MAVCRRPATGVAVETVSAALTAQAGRVVLAVTRSWTKSRPTVSKQAAEGQEGAELLGPVSGLQESLWPLQLQGSQALKAPSSGRVRRYPTVQRSQCCPW